MSTSNPEAVLTVPVTSCLTLVYDTLQIHTDHRVSLFFCGLNNDFN